MVELSIVAVGMFQIYDLAKSADFECARSSDKFESGS